MEGSEDNSQETEVITADQLKEKGNECVKKQDYKQAVVHYSEALRRAQSDSQHILFSNRSFAYLKNKEYFYALSDASRCIEVRVIKIYLDDFNENFIFKAFTGVCERIFPKG